MCQDEEASDKRIRPKEFTDADEIRIVENLIVSDAQFPIRDPIYLSCFAYISD